MQNILFLFESNLCIDCNDLRFQSTRDIYVRTYTLQAVNGLFVQQCGVLYRRHMPSRRIKRQLFFCYQSNG